MVDKIFISQPMTGFTVEEIKERRKLAETYCKQFFTENSIEFIDGLNENNTIATKNKQQLIALGDAIKVLSDAHYIYFIDGWESSKGCRVERLIAELYGIGIINKPEVQNILIERRS